MQVEHLSDDLGSCSCPSRSRIRSAMAASPIYHQPLRSGSALGSSRGAREWRIVPRATHEQGIRSSARHLLHPPAGQSCGRGERISGRTSLRTLRTLNASGSGPGHDDRRRRHNGISGGRLWPSFAVLARFVRILSRTHPCSSLGEHARRLSGHLTLSQDVSALQSLDQPLLTFAGRGFPARLRSHASACAVMVSRSL